MTEQTETRAEKSFGISRGLLARLVPITLFVALGTFAVVQSILGEKNAQKEGEQQIAKTGDAGQSGQPLLKSSPQEKANPSAPIGLENNKNPLVAKPPLHNENPAAFTPGANRSPPTTSFAKTEFDGTTEQPSGAFQKPNAANPGKPPIVSAADLLRQTQTEQPKPADEPSSGNKLPDLIKASERANNTAKSNFDPNQGLKTPNNTNNQSSGLDKLGPNSSVPESAKKLPSMSFSDDAASSAAADTKENSTGSSQFALRQNQNPNPADSPTENSLRLTSEPTRNINNSGNSSGANPTPENPVAAMDNTKGSLSGNVPPFANNPAVNQSRGNPANPIPEKGQPTASFNSNTNPQSPLNQSNLGGNADGNQNRTISPFNSSSGNAAGNAGLVNNSGQYGSDSNAPPQNVAIPRADRSALSQNGGYDPGMRTNPGRDSNAPSMAMNSMELTAPTPGNAELEGVQVPSISIEKLAPREIQIDQPTDFKIIIRNVGRVPANQVQVVDRIPEGVLFIKSVPEAVPDRNGTINWEFDVLKPNQEQSITLTLQPKKTGEIGSVAQVSFATPASMRTLVTKPLLAVEHTGPGKVMIGDRVSLEINVKNEGNGPARDVVIQENVPPQLKFAEDFNELEYEIGTLAPNQSRKVTLTLAAAQIGRFRNTVFVTAAGGLQSQHQIDMEVVAPKLELGCDGPNRRYLKRNASHAFSVRNAGTAIATNLDLVTKLPRGVKFVAANNQGQYDPGSHAVYWSLDKLNVGQTVSVELTTTPAEAGDHEFEFVATADLDQRAAMNQPLSVDHLVDLFFEIDDVDDVIEIGSETRYRIRLLNQGTAPATNVQLSLTCDSGIKPVSTDNRLPSEIRGQEVIFAPIATISPGEEFVTFVTASAVSPGEHQVVANLRTGQRDMDVSKEESTRVYADR